MAAPGSTKMSPSVPPTSLIARTAVCFVLGAAAAALHPVAQAQVTGISYTLTPVAERVYFDPSAGIGDGLLYGGRVGFGFGEYAELSGIYLLSRGLQTEFTDFEDLDEETQDAFDFIPERDVDLRLFGANLKFNLGSGRFFPFVSVGTGILEFDPENIEKARVIYLSGAAGLQVALADNFALLAQVQDLTYRYTPASVLLTEADLADLGTGAADLGRRTVHNLGLRVGLQVYLGGRAHGELTEVDRTLRNYLSGGFSGIRLQLEPLGGVIRFTDDLGFPEQQRMAGLRAGFDLGPYLGVRGFYWRGVKEGTLTDFDDLQAYGGELHLTFGRLMRGVSPRIVLGGGYLDVLDDFAESGGISVDDRPFASGGADLVMSIGRSISLHGGVRALLMSADDPEHIAEPSQIATSLMYSAGVSFGLGGRSAERYATADEPPPALRSPGNLDARQSAELDRISRQIDSLRAVGLGLQVPADGQEPGAAFDGTLPPESAVGGRWVTIPMPQQGELYVRYGEPAEGPPGSAGDAPVVYVDPATGRATYVGGTQDGRAAGESIDAAADGEIDAGDIERIVRDVLRRELRATGTTTDLTLGDAPTSESERRLLARIEELERRLADRQADLRAPDRSSPLTVRQAPGYQFAGVTPFVGFGLSSDQIGVFGIRADVRSRSLASASFLPELAMAVGTDGLSFALNANAAFPLGISIGSLRPYAGLGLGLITTGGSELVFNLLAGVERADSFGRVFVEYMNQDFFALNRFVIGYRIRF